MDRINSIITRPYPHILNPWKTIVLISIFISLFMIVFQPFGLQRSDTEGKMWILAGYGLVTFIILIFNMVILPALLPGILGEDRLTLGRHLLFLCLIVLCIAAGNYLYSVALHVVNWVGARGFIIFLAFTLLVAAIPMTGASIIRYNYLLRKNLASSVDINKQISLKSAPGKKSGRILSLSSENGKQQLSVLVAELLLIASEGNYVSVRYLEEDEPKQLMIRNTMKNIEEQVDDELLFKCHRAFIINPLFVEKVHGNSQGYRLRIQHLNEEVPVARSFTKAFRERIEDSTGS